MVCQQTFPPLADLTAALQKLEILENNIQDGNNTGCSWVEFTFQELGSLNSTPASRMIL